MNTYTEYMIEFDSSTLMVYVTGLDADGFWHEVTNIDDANMPSEFAEGYAQRLRDEGYTVQIVNITGMND